MPVVIRRSCSPGLIVDGPIPPVASAWFLTSSLSFIRFLYMGLPHRPAHRSTFAGFWPALLCLDQEFKPPLDQSRAPFTEMPEGGGV